MRASITAICAGCGAPFSAHPRDIRDRGRRFCSNSCGQRGRKRPTPEARFWGLVSPEPNSGCWLWTGALNGEGYACFGVDGATVGAHRWAYRHFVGAVPDGMEIDHKCRVRCCANPDHLEPVTPLENLLRSTNANALAHINGTCTKGHPVARGRRCGICRAAIGARYRAKRVRYLTP